MSDNSELEGKPKIILQNHFRRSSMIAILDKLVTVERFLANLVSQLLFISEPITRLLFH